MASKSRTVTEKEIAQEIKAEETPVTEKAAEEPKQPEAPKDEWDEEVEMIVPRKPKGEENFYYVCVNDRRYQVPANGSVQKLPKPIADILKESLDAEREADDFADHIPNKAV